MSPPGTSWHSLALHGTQEILMHRSPKNPCYNRRHQGYLCSAVCQAAVSPDDIRQRSACCACPTWGSLRDSCDSWSRQNAYIMRTKCDQKRECEFSTPSVSTTYNFDTQKCTHFYLCVSPSLRLCVKTPRPKNVTIMSPFVSPRIHYVRLSSYLRTRRADMVTFSSCWELTVRKRFLNVNPTSRR
jgi:hypothetical protein